MLREEIVVDKIDILESGVIQLRLTTRVYKDDVVIASSFHRTLLKPGDDLSSFSPRTQAIAQAAWSHL